MGLERSLWQNKMVGARPDQFLSILLHWTAGETRRWRGRALHLHAILGVLGVAQKVRPVIQTAVVLNPTWLLVVCAPRLGGLEHALRMTISPIDSITERSLRSGRQKISVIVVQLILFGGTTTRLWPISRQAYPRPLIGIVARARKPLPGETSCGCVRC